MSKEYIEKEAAINAIEDTSCYLCKKYIRTKKCDCDCEIWRNKKMLHDIPAADVKPVPAGGIGEMSDGYHTFNGLYYQRMILFAALVKAYKDRAWKSYRHEDGELCFGGGWFIVGIDTPAGSYTYHYENKHFDLFECKELPVGEHWDGHTEKDVTRLLKLEPAVPQEMSAREMFAARDRMCNSNYNVTPACKTCPLWRDNNGYYMYCGTLMTMRPLDFLAIVEAWAREHPERSEK